LKAYIITNLENENSRKISERHANKFLEFNDFEPIIFKACMGPEAYDIMRDLKIHFLDIRYQNKEFLERNNRQNYDLRPGIAGCFISHYYLWNACVQQGEPIGIFEYDALQVRKMPDVEFDDLLYLSAWRNFGGDSNKYYEERTEPGIWDYIGYDRWGFKNCMSGTHAILLKPHAAEELIRTTHDKGWFPVDRFLSSDICHVKKQTINPAVFKVKDSQNLTFNY
jgi:GR25 family glycosyltransferase involved in LPS biosynthesis